MGHNICRSSSEGRKAEKWFVSKVVSVEAVIDRNVMITVPAQVVFHASVVGLVGNALSINSTQQTVHQKAGRARGARGFRPLCGIVGVCYLGFPDCVWDFYWARQPILVIFGYH